MQGRGYAEADRDPRTPRSFCMSVNQPERILSSGHSLVYTMDCDGEQLIGILWCGDGQ